MEKKQTPGQFCSKSTGLKNGTTVLRWEHRSSNPERCGPPISPDWKLFRRRSPDFLPAPAPGGARFDRLNCAPSSLQLIAHPETQRRARDRQNILVLGSAIAGYIRGIVEQRAGHRHGGI